MSKVLIVGGAGYVGGWFTDESVKAGHEVRVLDNLTYEDSYLKNVDFATKYMRAVSIFVIGV